MGGLGCHLCRPNCSRGCKGVTWRLSDVYLTAGFGEESPACHQDHGLFHLPACARQLAIEVFDIGQRGRKRFDYLVSPCSGYDPSMFAVESHPEARRIERDKRPGICYAFTDDGVELPVIDLTHPAFSRVPDQAALEQVSAQFLNQMARQARMPRLLKRGLYWLISLRAPLMQATRGTSSGYLSGMSTYLLKLGPENLGTAYASRLDRVIASALPSLSIRLRLRNMVALIVEALEPLLPARPGRPLHLINIAGGPATDSINTLLLLRRDQPLLLADRAVHIHVLDIEASGAAFGRRALDALLADSGPLKGVQADFQYHHYDWINSRTLAALVEDWDLERSIVACSSEGGLFEYGDDRTVVSNLETLRSLLPPDTSVVGSVTRDGPHQRALRASGMPSPTPLRSREGFAALIARAGWELDRVIDNFMSYDVRIRLS